MKAITRIGPAHLGQTSVSTSYIFWISRAQVRRKADSDDVIPCVLEPELTDRNFRRNWARLIQKIYEVDPLVCPRCAGPMRVIAFIEQANVIRKILEHLGLWGSRHKPVPRANAPPVLHVAEYVNAYLPTSDDDMVDPIYPVDAYF